MFLCELFRVPHDDLADGNFTVLLRTICKVLKPIVVSLLVVNRVHDTLKVCGLGKTFAYT